MRSALGPRDALALTAAPRSAVTPRTALPRGRAVAAHAVVLLAFAVAVAVLAAIPRLSQLDRPITSDEPTWFWRTSAFITALRAGDWPATYRAFHPGVTTMWLGAVGMGFEPIVASRLNLLNARQASAFFGARRALALTSSALLALVALLVLRLSGIFVATCTAVLLALEPWLVAHNRVLHLDGLVSVLIAVAVLACLVRWQGAGGRGYVVLAGIAAGLAILTKTSALAILPPATVLLAAAGALQPGPLRARRLLLDLLVLAATASATLFALWPALWLDPLGTASQAIRDGLASGGEPHELGSYFLGRQVDDPGPAFYPIALAFRASPLLVLGLLLAGLALGGALRRRALAPGPFATLALAALLVVAVMTLAAKKQDRYVLPAVVLLAPVSAAGFARLVRGRRFGRPLVLAAVGVLQLLVCAGERPYFFSYYSPLLGGAAVARQELLIGWGEGLDPVATYLNSQPGTRNVLVPQSVHVAMEAQLRARTVFPAAHLPAFWQVMYVNSEQRGDRQRPEMVREVLTVRLDGVEYAHLYRAR